MSTGESIGEAGPGTRLPLALDQQLLDQDLNVAALGIPDHALRGIFGAVTPEIQVTELASTLEHVIARRNAEATGASERQDGD